MGQLKLSNPAIPLGSWILVTGCNGLIGSHCVDQFLAAGYKVRGTVRDFNRCQWIVDYFDKKYGSENFELFEVKGFYESGCFDEAVKGMSGVAHTTSHYSLTATEPEPHISSAIKTVLNALESAAKEPSVKRVVLTSSAWAAASPKPNVERTVDENSWNDEAVKASWSKDPPPNPFTVYSAMKTESERAAWKWVADHKPTFAFSTVLPETVLGTILVPSKQGIPSTSGFVKLLFEGENLGLVQMLQPQWFVDSSDTGKLHVAALVDPSVKSERILAYAKPFNWNDVLAIFRKLYPDRKFVPDLDVGRDISKVANARGDELLRKLWGNGWTSLEDCIAGNASSIVEIEAS